MATPTFTLFDNEEKVIEAGLQLAAQLEDAPPEIRDGVASLVDAYRKSTREQRRLVRFSDRLQEQVSAVNQELQRKKEEAELALTRLKEAQENLLQAEKLASLGALVAGVSHEINTPVGIALASASHLSETTAAIKALFDAGAIRKSDFQDYISTASEAAGLILSNCNRAAELINSFKQVAVDQTSAERRRFGLDAYLHEVLRSLSPKLRQAGVDVSVQCPTALEVDSYPGALSQVLTNFVMNSIIHGFDDGRRGHIRITVDQSGEDQVDLTYQDDGKGMPDAIRQRIFDPFFTTKRGSGGNGLGMHIVFNIVTGTLRGQINVESEEGGGTKFLVSFPRIAPRDDSSSDNVD